MKENVAKAARDFQPSQCLSECRFFLSLVFVTRRETKSTTVAAHLFHLEGRVLYAKKIKSQAPSKLLKLSPPEKKNPKKTPRAGEMKRDTRLCPPPPTSSLHTHAGRLGELQRQTHLVCLAVGAERRAPSPQGATRRTELYAQNKGKTNKPEM